MANYKLGNFTEQIFLEYFSKYLIKQCPFDDLKNLTFNNYNTLYNADFIDTTTNELWDLKCLFNNYLEKNISFLPSEIKIPCTKPDNQKEIMYTFSNKEDCSLIIWCKNGFALIYKEDIRLIKNFISNNLHDILDGKLLKVSNTIYIIDKTIHIKVQKNNLKEFPPIGIHNLYNHIVPVKEQNKILINYFLYQLDYQNFYKIKSSSNIATMIISNETFLHSKFFNILDEEIKQLTAKYLIDNALDYFIIFIPDIIDRYKIMILNKFQLNQFFNKNNNLFNCTFSFSKEKLTSNSSSFEFTSEISNF